MAAFDNPVPSFKIEYFSATAFKVTDMTGEYDNPDNENGWGGPGGADISCAGECTIHLVLPDGTKYSYDAYPDLPSDAYGFTTLNMSDFISEADGTTPWGESDEEIPDGIYTFWVDIQHNGVGPCVSAERVWVEQPYYYVLVANDLNCCITKKLTDIKFDCCEDDQSYKYMMLSLMFDAMTYAACKGDLEKAQELYDKAYKLCNTGDCGC